MGWREKRLSDRIIAQANTIRSAVNLNPSQAEAAVAVAELVEQVVREEKTHEGEAINLLDQEYQGTGLYRSVINRCVEYDKNS